MTAMALSYGALQVLDELSHILYIGFWHGENRKGKPSGLPGTDTGKLFKVSNEFIKVGHNELHSILNHINMTEGEKLANPLPSRYEAVRDTRAVLEQGIVLRPEDVAERYDISNAAQSIVIGPVLQKVIDSWEPIALQLTTENFYRGFALLYYRAVAARERAVWDSVCQEVVSDSSLDLNNLTPFQAAVLTLQSLGYEKAPASSRELFVELPMHAEQYEILLREQLGDTFTYEALYDHLREHFPSFLKRMISLDSVIIDLYRMNAPEQDRGDPNSAVMYAGSKLDTRFYQLDENDTFQIKPTVIKMFKQHAADRDLTQDTLGRTENRGCPFLLAEGRDEFIAFAIEEFITQHKEVFL